MDPALLFSPEMKNLLRGLILFLGLSAPSGHLQANVLRCERLFTLQDVSPLLGKWRRLRDLSAARAEIQRIRELLADFIPSDFMVPISVGPVIAAEAPTSESADPGTKHIQMQTRSMNDPLARSVVLTHEMGHVAFELKIEKDIPRIARARTEVSSDSARLQRIELMEEFSQLSYNIKILKDRIKVLKEQGQTEKAAVLSQKLDIEEYKRFEKSLQIQSATFFNGTRTTGELSSLYAGHTELFGDLVSFIHTQDPTAVARTLSGPAYATSKENPALRSFLLTEAEAKNANLGDPHDKYIYARIHLWKKIQNLNLNLKEQGPALLMVVYQAMRLDIQESLRMGLGKAREEDPVVANERLKARFDGVLDPWLYRLAQNPQSP